MSRHVTVGTHQWRGVIEEYRDRLPVTDATPVITLREGGTPLVAAGYLSELTGCEVYLKVEGQNPTGSFKDRGMTMAISKAAEDGAKAVICASTGNTSASAAAYAVKAGMVCAVLVPQGKIALGKLAQALVHGAKLLQVDGNFDDCLTLARKLSEHYPVALVNSVNPCRIEGQKTAAFEIVDFLGDAPDIHCLPVGNAGNITAYWKGFTRVRRRRRRHEAPARVGLPGRRRRADRQRRARHAPVDHRHRDPHRQPGVVGPGARGARRVRRPHRRRDRPRDPRGLPAARVPGGRLRRAGVGRLGRRAAAGARRGRARRRPAGRLHGHRPRPQGPGVGHRRCAEAGRASRSTRTSPRSSWASPDGHPQQPPDVPGSAHPRARAGDVGQPRPGLRRVRPRARPLRRRRRAGVRRARRARRRARRGRRRRCRATTATSWRRRCCAAFDALGGRPRGLDLVCANRIPHGRGLGSSAAAIVSGLVLARALVVGGEERLPDAALLELADRGRGPPRQRRGVPLRRRRRRLDPVVAARSTCSVSRRRRRSSPVVCVPSSSVAHQEGAGAAARDRAARRRRLQRGARGAPRAGPDDAARPPARGHRRPAAPALPPSGVPADRRPRREAAGRGDRRGRQRCRPDGARARRRRPRRRASAAFAGARFATSVLEVDSEGARVVAARRLSRHPTAGAGVTLGRCEGVTLLTHLGPHPPILGDGRRGLHLHPEHPLLRRPRAHHDPSPVASVSRSVELDRPRTLVPSGARVLPSSRRRFTR